MRNLFQKRARDYNSDDDEEEERKEKENAEAAATRRGGGGDNSSEGSDSSGKEKKKKVKFKLGSRVIWAQATYRKKLAEEEAERKVKGEAKKKNIWCGEGHVKPANYLDSHEKFLIGIATKGGEQSQKVQKGLDPSRSKDAKAFTSFTAMSNIFMTRLVKKTCSSFLTLLFTNPASDKEAEERSLLFRAWKDIIACTKHFQQVLLMHVPGWSCTLAPDNKRASGPFGQGPFDQVYTWAVYRTTGAILVIHHLILGMMDLLGPHCVIITCLNPKLKDWDKMADSAIVDDVGRMSEDSGSDDD
ncbi:B-box type zinc finger protein with CCT domain isoform 1 [Hibiscus syriacus]|uniref:B-box type zinc finger protein with CCT domain isoform 1 n=1 Tax=Hibiscus syriacus TaxID=106335 RepID=A0A6A2YIH9_HIBSY|nr:B-box type zinc finger protein with CCT domain isoform 1 [Hibiscus syriacus]